MSSLLERIAKFEHDPVDWMFYDDYYDRPLTGWIRVKGKRYYFSLLNQPLDGQSLWGVYHVPRAIRIPHLLSHRRWRQIVGWNHDRRPGEETRAAKPKVMDNFSRYSAEEEYHNLPDFHIGETGIRCRGLTDLKEVRWLVQSRYDAIEPEDR